VSSRAPRDGTEQSCVRPLQQRLNSGLFRLAPWISKVLAPRRLTGYCNRKGPVMGLKAEICTETHARGPTEAQARCGERTTGSGGPTAAPSRGSPLRAKPRPNPRPVRPIQRPSHTNKDQSRLNNLWTCARGALQKAGAPHHTGHCFGLIVDLLLTTTEYCI
jgi:hypothetical protein